MTTMTRSAKVYPRQVWLRAGPYHVAQSRAIMLLGSFLLITVSPRRTLEAVICLNASAKPPSHTCEIEENQQAARIGDTLPCVMAVAAVTLLALWRTPETAGMPLR
jgi:hypothetical protein